MYSLDPLLDSGSNIWPNPALYVVEENKKHIRIGLIFTFSCLKYIQNIYFHIYTNLHFYNKNNLFYKDLSVMNTHLKTEGFVTIHIIGEGRGVMGRYGERGERGIGEKRWAGRCGWKTIMGEGIGEGRLPKNITSLLFTIGEGMGDIGRPPK